MTENVVFSNAVCEFEYIIPTIPDIHHGTSDVDKYFIRFAHGILFGIACGVFKYYDIRANIYYIAVQVTGQGLKTRFWRVRACARQNLCTRHNHLKT